MKNKKSKKRKRKVVKKKKITLELHEKEKCETVS